MYEIRALHCELGTTLASWSVLFNPLIVLSTCNLHFAEEMINHMVDLVVKGLIYEV